MQGKRRSDVADRQAYTGPQHTVWVPQEEYQVHEADVPRVQDKRLYVLTACGIEMYGYTSYTYCKVGGKEVGTFVLEKE